VPCHRPTLQTPLLICGEAPGVIEELELRPFVGTVGNKVEKLFRAVDMPLRKMHLTNALLCRPRRKFTPQEWRKALDCCRPRLMQEIEESKPKVILAYGKQALLTLTGKHNLPRWVGGAVTFSPTCKTLATFHPSYALRTPEYFPIVIMHTLRAFDLAMGNIQLWHWPGFIIEEGAKLHRFLDDILVRPQYVGLDVETICNGTRITCIGIATEKNAASIWWPPEDNSIAAKVKEIVCNKETKIVMQNGQFDVRAFEQSEAWIVNGYDWDTMHAHQIVAPLLPHNLGFIAACELHAPRWKSEYKAIRKKSQLDEMLYNAKDAYITRLLMNSLTVKLNATHNGHAQFQEMMKLAAIGRRMSESGVRIHHENVATLSPQIRKSGDTAVNELKELATYFGFEGDFNLNSNAHLHKLFFGLFKVRPTKFSSKTMKPSLDKDVLLGLISHPVDQVQLAARLLLEARKWRKLLSTYITGVEKVQYVHPQWLPGKKTGRFGCKSPNLMNIPRDLRNIFRPHLERDFVVAADFQQLELRLIALLSGDVPLLEAFAEGRDAHTQNTWDFFGKENFSKDRRRLAKVVVFAICYLASDETIWRSVLHDFPKITLRAITQMKSRFLAAHPDIVRWQYKIVQSAKKHRYVECSLSGRRAYFHGATIDANIAANFPVQGTAADLMNAAIIKLDKMIDWQEERILAQVHDELVLAGPDVKKLATKLRDCMESELTINGHTCKFPIDFKIGKTWGEAEEMSYEEVMERVF